MESARETKSQPTRAAGVLGVLVLAYIGVYLCRKNLTVAAPLLAETWHLSKEELGLIASVSTIAYAIGKVGFGPLTDRLGGRTALLGSMLLVAFFGAAGAFATSLGMLTVFYSLNRLSGAASWGAMVKIVGETFGAGRLAFACGVLSLSFVLGGALAVAFAGGIARVTDNAWPAILGLPSLVLLGLAGLVALSLPRRKTHRSAVTASAPRTASGGGGMGRLFRNRTFLVILALSFTLNLLRETFNFWTVDFLRTEGGPAVSNAAAAFLSTPFDLCGAAGILCMGAGFGRLGPRGRVGWLTAHLGLLALLLAALPSLFRFGPIGLSVALGMIGFLVYGPYSLLAGVLAIEAQGQERAATVAGWVDGVGYLAGFFSGVLFGRLLTLGGYTLGFQMMAALTVVAAALSWFLYPRGVDPRAPRTFALDAQPTA